MWFVWEIYRICMALENTCLLLQPQRPSQIELSPNLSKLCKPIVICDLGLQSSEVSLEFEFIPKMLYDLSTVYKASQDTVWPLCKLMKRLLY